MCRLKFRPFLKVGERLKSVERSGINDILAYCAVWSVVADYSPCGGSPLTVRRSDGWRVAEVMLSAVINVETEN